MRRTPMIWIALIALACVLGIGSGRFALALPAFIAAYTGDTLWGRFLAFLGIGLFLPRASTRHVALLAIVFSVMIEVSRLYDAPWDRLDPPDDTGGHISRLWLPLERSRLLRRGRPLGVLIEVGYSEFFERRASR